MTQLCSVLFMPSNNLLFFLAKAYLEISGPQSLSISADSGFEMGLQQTSIIYLVLPPN